MTINFLGEHNIVFSQILCYNNKERGEILMDMHTDVLLSLVSASSNYSEFIEKYIEELMNRYNNGEDFFLIKYIDGNKSGPIKALMICEYINIVSNEIIIHDMNTYPEALKRIFKAFHSMYTIELLGFSSYNKIIFANSKDKFYGLMAQPELKAVVSYSVPIIEKDINKSYKEIIANAICENDLFDYLPRILSHVSDSIAKGIIKLLVCNGHRNKISDKEILLASYEICPDPTKNLTDLLLNQISLIQQHNVILFRFNVSWFNNLISQFEYKNDNNPDVSFVFFPTLAKNKYSQTVYRKSVRTLMKTRANICLPCYKDLIITTYTKGQGYSYCVNSNFKKPLEIEVMKFLIDNGYLVKPQSFSLSKEDIAYVATLNKSKKEVAVNFIKTLLDDCSLSKNALKTAVFTCPKDILKILDREYIYKIFKIESTEIYKIYSESFFITEAEKATNISNLIFLLSLLDIEHSLLNENNLRAILMIFDNYDFKIPTELIEYFKSIVPINFKLSLLDSYNRFIGIVKNGDECVEVKFNNSKILMKKELYEKYIAVCYFIKMLEP